MKEAVQEKKQEIPKTVHSAQIDVQVYPRVSTYN